MVENQLRFKRESRRDSERLGETRRNLEGGMVGAVGMVPRFVGGGSSQRDSGVLGVLGKGLEK